MSTQITKQIDSSAITDKLSKFNFANLFKSSKALNNSSINNIPDITTYLNQKKLSPVSTKSTQGLVGFEGDSQDVTNGILLGQNVSLDSIAEFMRQEQFGQVQIDTLTSGGTQSKSVPISADILTTISQEQIARLSVSQRAQLDAIWKKLTNAPSPFLAVQTLTNDALNRSGQGQSPKVTIAQGTGLRAFIDNLNNSIQGKISAIGTLKPQSKPTGNDLNPTANITNSSSADLNAVSNGDPQSFDSVSLSDVAISKTS